jgi:hypothetical protein
VQRLTDVQSSLTSRKNVAKVPPEGQLQAAAASTAVVTVVATVADSTAALAAAIADPVTKLITVSSDISTDAREDVRFLFVLNPWLFFQETSLIAQPGLFRQFQMVA